MEIKNKVICPKAWKELAISPNGLITPCCVYEEPLSDDEGNYFHISKDKLADVWNSKAMRDIRLKMLAGERISGCSQCYFQEDHSKKSKRIESFLQAEYLNEDSFFYSADKDGSLDIGPRALDLKLGNKCNLACRMCQPKDSNFVAKQFSEIAQEEKDFVFYQNTMPYDPVQLESYESIGKWSEEDFFQSQFKSISGNITDLQIAGGEPLLQEEFYAIVEEMIDSGQSKNCNLFISTNLSSLPKKCETLHKHFKAIHWGISVDAYGDELEYIRYPLKWPRFEENVRKLSSLYKNEKSNVKVSFSITAQALNILTLDNLLKYYFDDFIPLFSNNAYNLSINSVTYPEHLAYKILPESIKELAYTRIQPFLKISEEKRFTKEGSLAHDGLEQICSILKNKNLESDKKLCYSLLKYSDSIDKKRNQKMSTFMPELAEHLAKYLGDTKYELTFNKSVLKSMGWIKASQGLSKEAISIFERVIKHSDDYESYKALGEIFYGLGRTKEAFHSYEKAISLNDTESSLIKTVAWNYAEQGLYVDAIRLFEKFIERESDFEVYKSLGFAYESIKKLEKCIENFEKALLIRSDIELLKHLGWKNIGLGRNPIAMDYFEQVLVLNSEDPEALLELKRLKTTT